MDDCFRDLVIYKDLDCFSYVLVFITVIAINNPKPPLLCREHSAIWSDVKIPCVLVRMFKGCWGCYGTDYKSAWHI